jgi:uncharacterized membrane protein
MQTNEEKTYQIRFNTNSTTDVDRWRLVCDGGEQLVSNIVIDSQTYTTKDYIEGVGDKWHVSCTGVLHIKDGIAHITVKRKDNALRRHLFKTISYRILGTITTVTVAYSLGMSFEISSLLGVGELVLKPILYFLHERLWYRFGKTGG